MTKTLHGKVRGRIIELDEDPGVEDGQQVEVVLSTFSHAQATLTASDLLNSGLVGIWADRMDIGNSLDFARRLREQAQTRKT